MSAVFKYTAKQAVDWKYG